MIFHGSGWRASAREDVERLVYAAGFDPGNCGAAILDQSQSVLVMGMRSAFRSDGKFDVLTISAEALASAQWYRVGTLRTHPLDPGVTS